MTAHTPTDTIGGPATTPRGSLSPSRAADFKTCPLLYRFRSIDRIAEQPTIEQARGTLVHAILERLFDAPPAERTETAATALIATQWARLTTEQPTLGALFDTNSPSPEFVATTTTLLAGYFAVEDPRRLEPAERETLVHTLIDGDLLLRGYIDRLDIAPNGDLRVVDYKTGAAPHEAYESRALFQLKFYALVLWRTRGVVPRMLRLLYLKDAQSRDYSPDADELARFERTLIALWQAIDNATRTANFRPTPSKLCAWCAHQALCPTFGGTPPPMPTTLPTPRAATPTPADAPKPAP